jgi:hypothetical protein
MFRRTSAPHRFIAFAVALAFLVPSAGHAAPAMVNCAQEEHEEGDSGNLIHFAVNEDCFANRDARFFGFAVLIRHEGEKPCKATLSPGVFDGSRWVWGEPETFAFKRFETREVYYDLTQETNIPVGKIVLLNTGKDMQLQCDGNLTVRFTKNNPLPSVETYYGTQDLDAYFKIMSEDVVRKPRGIPAQLGRSFVRLPIEGLYRHKPVITYEFYTDVTHARSPLDKGKEDDPSDDEHFYSQYHLESWDDAARVWETVIISRAKDVSTTVVQCSDDTIDCYGDRGEIGRVLPDGHYRLRVRHYWGKRGWQTWSPWRRFNVNFSTPLLAEPDLDPTFRTLFELWLRNSLLGPKSLWR